MLTLYSFVVFWLTASGGSAISAFHCAPAPHPSCCCLSAFPVHLPTHCPCTAPPSCCNELLTSCSHPSHGPPVELESGVGPSSPFLSIWKSS